MPVVLMSSARMPYWPSSIEVISAIFALAPLWAWLVVSAVSSIETEKLAMSGVSVTEPSPETVTVLKAV